MKNYQFNIGSAVSLLKVKILDSEISYLCVLEFLLLLNSPTGLIE